MKKYPLLLLTFALVVNSFAQSNKTIIEVNECEVSASVSLTKPVISDSLNIFGDKFDVKRELNTYISQPFYTKNAVKTTASDGWITCNDARNSTSTIRLFSFTVSNTLYAKATLKVTTPKAVVLFIDNKKTTEKTSFEKSLDKAETAKCELQLEPGTHHITVKCLSLANDSLPAAVKIAIETGQAPLLTVETKPAKRQYTISDVLEGDRPSAVLITDAGRYAMLRTTTVLPKGKRFEKLFLYDMETGNIIQKNIENKGYHPMPVGNKLYYTEEGINGKRLVVVDLPSFTETVIAEDLPEGAINLSQSGAYLIINVTDQATEVKDGGVHRIITPADRQGGWRNRSFLYKYDIATGSMQQLVFGNRSVHLSAISPDEKTIVFTTSRDKYTERPFSEHTICLLNLATMKIDTLFANIKNGGVSTFSPDGKKLLLTGGPESFNNIGKDPAVKGIPNSADNQAYIYDIATKQIEAISKTFNPSINSAKWNKADNLIYFVVADEDFQRCYRYNTVKKTFDVLKMSVEYLSAFHLGGNYALCIGESAARPPVAFKYDVRTQKETILTAPAENIVKEVMLAKVENWDFTSQYGNTVRGRVYLPPNFDASKKYPAIVYYYGGTTPVSRTFDGRYPFHLYANQGYVVYVLQPSGAIGFGQEYSARHVNAWGEYTANEIIEGTQKFCDAHPYVNRSKLGCMGASYGGFMTMYLQTRTDIFAAAMSHAGISDVTSYWGEGYWGYSYNSLAAADSYPWNNLDLFIHHSPLFSADKIKTPILLLHGNVDTNVPPGESIQMFTALKILGKTVEYISIDGENHHILDFDKRIRWNNSIMAWFARWLHDDDTWWKEMYPKEAYEL
ncbi:MAG: prolyl oligopeptidase family serine peptidase [Bacteroidales bacterium]|jgi:dipeptidyl aminopeptidase/acylaminoacyl peptidase|nr:prolyl oligopeptidase family serine peptidase [Bacteroidales bacterium]